jgi:hypothetical protein
MNRIHLAMVVFPGKPLGIPQGLLSLRRHVVDIHWQYLPDSAPAIDIISTCLPADNAAFITVDESWCLE